MELIALMMEATRTSEMLVNNYFTRQYIPEDKSELQRNIHFIWRPRTINSYKIEKITMGWACAKSGESKYTHYGDGWSYVWKTPSKET
jgi:hypothetical protein